MRDTELYERVLGLSEPWSVSEVELNVASKRVDVWVEHPPEQKWPCPKCGHELSCRDHAEERVWRHLDTCQFQTHLRARIPRVDCPEHGVLNVLVPWAEARSRFTLMMECLLIDVLEQCATVTGACRLLGVSWDEGFGVMQRAVDFEAIKDEKLKTARAWAIKECLRDLWDYRSVGWARKFFRSWFGWARRSRLKPVKKVAAMIQNHLDNILTYCKHQITNAVAEGLNSKIMSIKRRACGYRNKENFKLAIYFFGSSAESVGDWGSAPAPGIF